MTAHRIAAYLIVLMGLAHTVLTPVFIPTFAAAAVWFAGAGIALVFLGLLNLAARYCISRGVRLLTIAANVIGVAYGLCIVMVVPEPQAFAALAMLIVLLGGAVAFHCSEVVR